MGLEEIVQNINSDTEARVKQTLKKAKEEADKITEAAEQQAKGYLQKAKEDSDNEAKQLTLRELSRANIEAKAAVQEATDSAIRESLDLVEDQTEAYFGSPGYTKLLNKLAQQARDELGDGCVLHIQEYDVQKVKKAPDGATIVTAQEKFSGGLKGVSKDNSMFVDYSMPAIMKMINSSMAVAIQKKIVE